MFPYLRTGDTIAVVSPSGPVAKGPFMQGVSILSGRYHLVYDDRLAETADSQLPYLANNDALRALQFNTYLNDERVKAIVCSRGGYGSSRILDQLDDVALKQRRIPIVGFSDITAIHCWALSHSVVSIHGPVVSQMGRLPGEQVDALYALLEGRRTPHISSMHCLVPGTARGQLVGGNLSLLSHLCGTRYFPNCDDAIVMLEDVNETPYRVDRMLTQLLMSGVLANARGLVLGEFTLPSRPQAEGIDGCTQSQQLHRVFCDRLVSLNIPVAINAPFGHGAANLPLPLGITAILDATHGTLRFE